MEQQSGLVATHVRSLHLVAIPTRQACVDAEARLGSGSSGDPSAQSSADGSDGTLSRSMHDAGDDVGLERALFAKRERGSKLTETTLYTRTTDSSRHDARRRRGPRVFGQDLAPLLSRTLSCKFRTKREITLIARGMKLMRLCSHAPGAVLLPARVGQYEPFGDPYERKRDEEEKRLQDAPQEAAVAANTKMPKGTYRASCFGCSLEDGRSGPILRCTQCLDERSRRSGSTLLLSTW